MRSSTLTLQIICCILGVVFIALAFTSGKYLGGFLLGSLMFFAAALLGADHTTNTNVKSRSVFQVMAGLSALPFVTVSMLVSVELFQSGRWADFVADLLRLLVFTLCALAITFGNHPIVQRQLKKLGFSTPPK
ncbi:MAG: hypothetical protein HYU78_11410 [Rhodocyclales bacterium]|nr:hypothetical protein [Rhodocyclales bacterium]